VIVVDISCLKQITYNSQVQVLALTPFVGVAELVYAPSNV
jgi:hypothetical protein